MRSVDAIGGIRRTIVEIGEITTAIAAAVTEQGAATQEIARSADIASRRTRDTADEVASGRASHEATRKEAFGREVGCRQCRAFGARHSRPGRTLLPESARGVIYLVGHDLSENRHPLFRDHALELRVERCRNMLRRHAVRRPAWRRTGCRHVASSGCWASQTSSRGDDATTLTRADGLGRPIQIVRAFTSTNTTRPGRRAIRSTSPTLVFQRRADDF